LLLLERTRSNKLVMLEALLRRLDASDQDYLYFKENYNRQLAGFEGEKWVDREWFDMPDLGSHYLLFNYEFENEFGYPHQIDTLLLNPKFMLILEIKNISGRVDIDENKHQMIITRLDNTLKSYASPIDQIRRHSQHLNRLLNQLKISLPIEGALVFSNPATIIGNVPNNFPIFHTSGLRHFVQKLLLKYKEELPEKQITKLSKVLLARLKRVEVKPTIDISRIRKGVLCEYCAFQYQMKYKGGSWGCPNCGSRNKHDLQRALNDYRILINNSITNREFRDFFNIESVYNASKILSNLNLEAVGDKRGRSYLIPNNIFEMK